jgi:Electron transfer DM13
MKYRLSFIISSVFIITLLAGCSKSQDSVAGSPVVPTDSVFNPAGATLLKQGSFSGAGGHTVSGSVKLYEKGGNRYIYLENFSSTAGPDLKVYLSTDQSASQFISLGSLKANSGAQVYLLSNSADIMLYNKVLIWCQQFTVLFGVSVLQ